MAKKKATPASLDTNLHIRDLEACVQELVDAINRVRANVTKASLELIPPIDRIAVDQALIHAKRLGAKGLETEPQP